MLIPEQGKSVYRLRLPKLTLQIFAMMGVILLVVVAIVLLDYSSLLNRVLESRELRRENVQLRTQIKEVQSKVSSLETNLDRIHSFAAKLRTITNVGSNTEAREYAKQEQATMGAPLGVIPEVTELNRRVQHVAEYAAKQERFLEETFDLLKDKTSILAATPSLVPAQGWIGSGFGYRMHPVTQQWKMHEGIDVVAYTGAQIVAPADGTVQFSGTRGEYGKVVVINHGFGIETLYGHCSQIMVQVGDRVRRGQVIALVGATGMTTGPHLHYEVHINGVPVDPANYLLQ